MPAADAVSRLSRPLPVLRGGYRKTPSRVGINLLDFLREDDEGKSGIPTEERIGEKVKALRLMRGMNQTELAEKSGVADSTISSIERGERYGIVTTYLYLAEALDVSIAALLGGE